MPTEWGDGGGGGGGGGFVVSSESEVSWLFYWEATSQSRMTCKFAPPTRQF